MPDIAKPAFAMNITLPAQKRGGEALLSVAPNITADQLLPLSSKLSSMGMMAVPDTKEDGSPLLRVCGFKHGSELLQLLKSEGVDLNSVEQGGNKAGPKGLLSRMKTNSLRTSGFVYLLGDFSLFFSGLLSGRSKEALAGMLYASGGAVSARYGNPGIDRQLKNVGARLGDFLTMQGAQIQEDSALNCLMKQRRGGLTEKVENFLYQHPSEIHNAIYAYGGTQLAASGLNERGKSKSWWSDATSGGLVAGGGLIGALVSEKHKDPKNAASERKRGGLLGWIQEKPLRVAGIMYTINNIFLIRSAFTDHKEAMKPAAPLKKSWFFQKAPSPLPEKDFLHKHHYIFKFLTAGFFLVANTFMSLSSKDHIAAHKGENEKGPMITAIAAQTIAAQPEELRSMLIRQAANFLSVQPETRSDPAELEAMLARKVTALQTLRKSAQPEMTQIAQPQEEKAKSGPAWSTRVPSPGINLTQDATGAAPSIA